MHAVHIYAVPDVQRQVYMSSGGHGVVEVDIVAVRGVLVDEPTEQSDADYEEADETEVS